MVNNAFVPQRRSSQIPSAVGNPTASKNSIPRYEYLKYHAVERCLSPSFGSTDPPVPWFSERTSSPKEGRNLIGRSMRVNRKNHPGNYTDMSWTKRRCPLMTELLSRLLFPYYEMCCAVLSRSVMSDSLRP